MMRNMKLINLTIWMFGGIIWGFFMYMSFNDFKFTFDSRLFFIVLVGSVFFGLVSGLLFGRVSYINAIVILSI